MKVFAINNEETKQTIGYLFHYEKVNDYIIELDDALDEWSAPLLFMGLVKKGIYTVPKDLSKLWVEGRVIPSGRQNIGLILKNAGMKEYNEAKLLKASKGKCSQDSDYVKEMKASELPDWVKNRQKDNIKDCFWSAEDTLLLLCEDDTVRQITTRDLIACNPKVETFQKNQRILNTVRVDVGGYGIIFNGSIGVAKKHLLEKADVLPIKASSFYSYARNNVLSTAEACESLGFTRQNLSYLSKTEALKPIKEGTRENLFLKGDIDRVGWG